MKDKKLGKYNFSVASDSKKGPAPGSAKAVWVTACGNFGLVASSTGVIHMYNMQSGARRKSFDLGSYPLDEPEAGSSKKKAERSVTGLASDALDRVVIASTLDGTLNVSYCFYVMMTFSCSPCCTVLQFPHYNTRTNTRPSFSGSRPDITQR